MKGIINVLKPPGITSHDVVDIIRRLTNEKKVGHTGTLDPGAAGVLPVCVGKATKVARFFIDSKKTYRGELTLGLTTASQDIYSDVTQVSDASKIAKATFIDKIKNFRGSIEQIPPMYSAVRIKGKKLYKHAREGKIVDRNPRPVYIYRLEYVKSEDWGTRHPKILLDVECSKGTYIRTLFSDIGSSLQCGGVMSFLLRTKVGGFEIGDAWTLEELADACRFEKLDRITTSLNQSLSFLPGVLVKSSAEKPVSSGNPLYPPGVEYAPEGLVEGDLIRLCSRKELLALAKVINDKTNNRSRQIYKVDCVLA